MKILIVDDSLTMQGVIGHHLTNMGLKDFAIASDGLEALEHCEKEKVNLVLLDWNMPKMDGYTALQNLKKDPKYSDPSVIMVTSESDKSFLAKAIAAGAVNYVIKPFSYDELSSKIQNVFS